MFKIIRELFAVLTLQQRKRFFKLQILVVLTAFAEVLGVAAIGPFMMLVVNQQSLLESQGLISQIYVLSGIKDQGLFVFYSGLIVLVVLCLGSFISILTTWKLARFSTAVGAQISSRLFSYYMHQPWLFHSSGSSSTLVNKIASDSARVTTQILMPFMQINARSVLTIFLVVMLFIHNPIVATIGLVTFSSAYLLVYKLVKPYLARSGAKITKEQAKRYKNLSEGFGGVKDLLLLGRQQAVVESYEVSSKMFARAQGNIQIFSLAPRYMIELISYGALIFLTLYLLGSGNDGVASLLSSLAVYGLAGFKLLPALQNIYSGMTNIKGAASSFENIRQDLYFGSDDNAYDIKVLASNIRLEKEIKLRSVSFCYPNKQSKALHDINLVIPANKSVAFVGSSGSGKSTLIDVILGLLEPSEGDIFVDGEKVTNVNKKAWQRNLGYVPQSIFLSEASIKENIAFGLSSEKVDDDLVLKAIKLANLEDVVSDLPDGINTHVGERGVKLSGGQRQRIGIARALYSDVSVLIFDEATSALDGVTEKMIMESIQSFAGKKTLIMIAHRLATVRNCDVIYLMDKGRIIDSGTYLELIEKNNNFKEMANLA